MSKRKSVVVKLISIYLFLSGILGALMLLEGITPLNIPGNTASEQAANKDIYSLFAFCLSFIGIVMIVSSVKLWKQHANGFLYALCAFIANVVFGITYHMTFKFSFDIATICFLLLDLSCAAYLFIKLKNSPLNNLKEENKGSENQ